MNVFLGMYMRTANYSEQQILFDHGTTNLLNDLLLRDYNDHNFAERNTFQKFSLFEINLLTVIS